MDPLSIFGPTVAAIQVFKRAVDAMYALDQASDDISKRRLLRQISLCISILEGCMGMIQTAPEGKLSEAIVEAARHCAELGEELAHRQEKLESMTGKGTRKRIAFVLAPWEKLFAMQKDFQNSVTVLHALTQDLMLQELIEGQNELRFAAANGFRERYYSARETRHDWESNVSGVTSFTVGQGSIADVVTLADEVVARSVARGIHFETDPSLILGTIAVTHESRPRFVPVRAKYDTGADVNFVPFALVEKNGLSAFLVELEDDGSGSNVFIGLNNQEYLIHHTITLKWCAATMHNVRTTYFHVADDLPYDMLLGNPFIQENRIFDPQRIALPLRRKHPNAAQRKEEERLKQAHGLAAAEELARARNEDKRKRELEREARRLAKAQTSSSSMVGASTSRLSLNTGSLLVMNSGSAVVAASSSSMSVNTGTPVTVSSPGSLFGGSSVFSPGLSQSTSLTTQTTASSSAETDPTNGTTTTVKSVAQSAATNTSPASV